MAEDQDQLFELDGLADIRQTNPGFVMPTIRPTTMAVLDELAAANRAHFNTWVKVTDEFRPAAGAREAEGVAWTALGVAAEESRSYARADTTTFESERHALTVRQLVDHWLLERELETTKGASARDAVRRRQRDTMMRYIGLVDAAMVAASWPYRGELVLAGDDQTLGWYDWRGGEYRTSHGYGTMDRALTTTPITRRGVLPVMCFGSRLWSTEDRRIRVVVSIYGSQALLT